jgi:hypothetical protein
MGPVSIEGPQSGLPVGKGPTGGTRSGAEMGPVSIKGPARKSGTFCRFFSIASPALEREVDAQALQSAAEESA